MASGGRRGAGERVLESRHVIGLFLLMLVFSGVFFALGYVMGRNQYDGQVRAANNGMGILEPVPKTSPIPPQSKQVNARNSAPLPVVAPRTPVERNVANAPMLPNGTIVLQVAALARQDDAQALAGSLQKKHF